MSPRGLLLLIVLVLSACGGKPAVTQLRIGMNPWPGYAQLAVAVEAGLLREQGIEARLVEYTSLHDLRRGFAAGHIDVLPSTLVEVVALHAAGERLPEVVWIADESCGGDMVLARGGKSLQQLRGARIAFEAGGLGDYLLSRLLDTQQLTRSDVEAVSMDQERMVDAMAHASIDFAITYPPFAARMLTTPGTTKVFDSSELPSEVLDTISIDRALLDADPTLLPRFHAALLATHAHCERDPAAARRTMLAATGMTEGEFATALQGLRLHPPAEQARWLRDVVPLQQLAARIAALFGQPAPVAFTLGSARRSPLLPEREAPGHEERR